MVVSNTPRRAGFAGVAALLVVVAGGCGSEEAEAPVVPLPTTAVSPAAKLAAGERGAAAVLSATQDFIAMLSDGDRQNLIAERTPANLSQWSEIPDMLFKRAGLRMDQLTPEQQTAVQGILGAGLSEEGYEQVTAITVGDGVLKVSGGTDLDYGTDHYWIRVLGTPSAVDKWTLQYGGHNLAVNLTMKGDEMTMAPTLWGAQPVSYGEDGETVEPLRGETAKAFALMDALDEEQRADARLDTPVTEMVQGAQKDGMVLHAEGAQASGFDDKQKDLLLELIDEWLGPLNDEAAERKFREAEQGLEQVTFGWSGERAEGKLFYYRLHGPEFSVEYVRDGDKIHSVYREPGNDYGAAM